MMYLIAILGMNYLVGTVVPYVHTIIEEYTIPKIKRVLQVYFTSILMLKKGFDCLKSNQFITKFLVQRMQKN